MASANNLKPDQQHSKAAWEITVGLARLSDIDVYVYMSKIAPRVYEEIIQLDENFSPEAFVKLNKTLFAGVNQAAGKLRSGNLKNKLLGDLNEALDFDFDEIKIDDLIDHFAQFIQRLFKNKYVGCGLAVTCAVFFIKYLKLLGFDYLNYKPFEKDSQYFKSALESGNTKALKLFLGNFIFNKNNKLTGLKSAKTGAVNSKAVNENEAAVLKAIKANPNITQEELAKKVGKSVRTVKTITKTLADKGSITRQNGKRYGQWIVN